MAEHHKDQAAVALGRKGGSKKVPKGFAMKTAEERTAAGKSGMVKRWGKIIQFSGLTVACLPRDVERIMEAATKTQEDGTKREPMNLESAVLSLILDGIAPYGLGLVVANGPAQSDCEISEYTEHWFDQPKRSK